MELIVADSSGKTLFPISDFELDMDSGWGDGVDNTFDLVVRDPSVPLPGAAWRVFADGLEIGGRVEGFELKTGRTSSELHWTGSTWTGVLEKRLLWPDPGQDYLVLSGDANAVLRSAGLRLDARWVGGSCRLQAVKVTDWRGRVDSDLVNFDLKSDLLVTNHLKAAGKGELAARDVVDVYADREGGVGTVKAMAGVFELEEYYDANNTEGDDLRDQALSRLEDKQSEGSVTVTVNEGVEFGLGDIVEARHYSPNVTVSVEISSKIVKVAGSGYSATYGASPGAVGR